LAKIHEEDFKKLFLDGTSLIDVRAPVEFAQGSLPGAVNLPIMNDEERAAVGTAYKTSGREVAMALGHHLVSGPVKEARMAAWTAQIQKNPQSVLYCFRGGLRSQITQGWLAESGVHRPLIEGGYKKVRQFLRDEIDRLSRREFLLLSGPTGSAKTHLLAQAMAFYPAVDLEGLAHHRGSAFGAWSIPQPPQIDFENRLAVGLLKMEPDPRKWLFEDESRLIGRSVLPDSLFNQMRQSPVLMVEESFEQRVENIFADYITNTVLTGDDPEAARGIFLKYKTSAQAISRKLGGARTQEVLADLQSAEEDYFAGRGLEANKAWIAKLLRFYYDPLYLGSLDRRQVQVVFKGRSAEILDMLKNPPR
jgi:tRNA 2-selenouridine synthase